jgi:hypothetical protein
MSNNQELILHRANKRSGGAYSDVFRNPETNRAYKLFLNIPPPVPGSPTAKRNAEIRRQVFADECEAYRLANGVMDLASHLPEFFGETVVADVLDQCGLSIAQNYFLDCCYSMAWVEGPVEKLYDCKAEFPHLEVLERKFNQAGINYTRDASIIRPEDEQRAVLIDFGTRAFELEHEELPFTL